FVWDSRSGELRFDRDGPAQRGVMALALDRSAERLVWAADGGNLRVWDTTTGDKLAGMRVDGLGFVAAVAIAEDGRVATGDRDKGRVSVWDPVREALLAECRGVPGPVRALAFEPSGVRLAVASEDGSLQLFDSRSGHELRRWQVGETHPRRLSFDDEGLRLVAAGPGSTWTWIDTRSVAAPEDVVVGLPLDAPILRDVDETPPTFPEDGRVPMARLAVPGYDPPELRSDPAPWTLEDFPPRVQILAGKTILTTGYPIATESLGDGDLRCLLSRFPPGCCFGSVPVADEWIEVLLDGAGGLDPNRALEVEGVLEVGEVIDELGFVQSIYRLDAR
ncbi:MAG: hypothetical protein O2816_16395, partial [Planctomycetota bacterium]|nr:hypothetical protein [Planctomycetota bacterium]